MRSGWRDDDVGWRCYRRRIDGAVQRESAHRQCPERLDRADERLLLLLIRGPQRHHDERIAGVGEHGVAPGVEPSRIVELRTDVTGVRRKTRWYEIELA